MRRNWVRTAPILRPTTKPTTWLLTSTGRQGHQTCRKSTFHCSHRLTGADRVFTLAVTSRGIYVHGNEHWTEVYTDYGVDLQKQFFDHFLKGEDTGWAEQPNVQLQVRSPDERFEKRHEDDWPLPNTDWTRYYLHPDGRELSRDEQTGTKTVTYDALGDGLTFLTAPLEEAIEITGPISSKVFVESDTEDTDLFVTIRLFQPDMEEVVFQGAIDPHTPIGQGWLRASQRKLDKERSEEWRPYHAHDEKELLEPGKVYLAYVHRRARRKPNWALNSGQ